MIVQKKWYITPQSVLPLALILFAAMSAAMIWFGRAEGGLSGNGGFSLYVFKPI